jgi:class 3 adenylate cyclase
MPDRPTGTVTFLFTDIEESTQQLRELGADRYRDALENHRRLLRDMFARHAGYEVDTQGDAFFIAFSRAQDAIRAAGEAQRALAAHARPGGRELRVRMGIHTCEATATSEGYVGVGVHRGARICAAGHGGQVLLSHTTYDLIEEEDTGFSSSTSVSIASRT